MFKLAMVTCFLLAINLGKVTATTFETKYGLPKEATVKISPKLGSGYNVEIATNNNQIKKLNLKPIENSIFSPNFKYQTASLDPNGQLKLEGVPMARDSFERHLYVDSDKQTVLQIKRLWKDAKRQDELFEVNGVSGDQRIFFADGKHFTINKDVDDAMTPLQDYSPAFDSDTKKNADRPVYRPELTIVVDYTNFIGFQGNNEAIVQYLSIFMHGVNTRYDSIESLDITFSISEIIAMKKPEDEHFIHECYRLGNGTCQTPHLLSLFSKWVNDNSVKLVRSDIKTLVHNVQKGDGYEGASRIGYVCSHNFTDPSDPKIGLTDWSTAIVSDHGGNYGGVHTMTHELAHNLGAPHDGEYTTYPALDSTSCPKEDGYIMSYWKYGGLNKFKFSPCSIQNIANNLKQFGSCTQYTDSGTSGTPVSNLHGGDVQLMLDQCQRQNGFYGPQLSVYTYGRSLDQQCRKLICLVQGFDVAKESHILTEGYYPAERSLCGVNGICQDGYCVEQPSLTKQCQKELSESSASVDYYYSPNELCDNLACFYNNSNGNIESLQLKKPAVEYSPCGLNGRCRGGVCYEAGAATSMTIQCAALLADKGAKVLATDTQGVITPDLLCSALTCEDSKGARFQSPLPPHDFTPCGDTSIVNKADQTFCYRGTCNTMAYHSENSDHQ